MINYEKFASEWIREMRGTRSQPQLSRMLGYNSNVVYSWESGRRFPPAKTLLALLKINRVNMDALWSDFFATPPSWEFETGAEAISEILRELRSNLPILDIAKKTGFSRFAISRWLRGQSEPRLPDFFAVIEAMSLRLLDFIALTTDISQIECISEHWERLEKARSMAVHLPWSHAVLRVLELDEYRQRIRHDEQFIAHKLGIATDLVKESIDALSETNQIKKEKDHWVPGAILSVDTRGTKNKFALKTWWTEVGLGRIPSAQNGQFSYNLFTVSEADFEKIRALHLSYFRAVRAIVAESTPAEKVAIVNLHLFDLGDVATKKLTNI